MSRKSPSSNPHRLHLHRSYATADQARAIYSALCPEVDTIPGARSTTTLEQTGTALEVHITATDLSALRAAKQTWLTLLQAAESTTTA